MACVRLKAHNDGHMVAETTQLVFGDLLLNSGLSMPRVFAIRFGALLNQTQQLSLYARPEQGLER